MRKISLLLITISMLSGCASFYDRQVSNPDLYHKPVTIDNNFNISGRFSIITSNKNYYGNFEWQHESSLDNLALVTPLGNTVAQITVESSIATLKTNDDTYRGDDLDELLTKQLGFTLPINYLHYWVQGVPLPQYPVESSLNSGFKQLGWNIEYLKWQDENHPEIVQVSKPNLRIKLLTNW